MVKKEVLETRKEMVYQELFKGECKKEESEERQFSYQIPDRICDK